MQPYLQYLIHVCKPQSINLHSVWVRDNKNKQINLPTNFIFLSNWIKRPASVKNDNHAKAGNQASYTSKYASTHQLPHLHHTTSSPHFVSPHFSYTPVNVWKNCGGIYDTMAHCTEFISKVYDMKLLHIYFFQVLTKKKSNLVKDFF